MSVYQIITDKILEYLKHGVVPWKQPFVKGLLPRNFVTNRQYSGINLFLLNMGQFASPFWLTFKQIQANGGSIRKGEKATQIIFCKTYKVEEEKEGEIKIKNSMSMRYYWVFNLCQVDGIPEQPLPAREMKDPIQACEDVVLQMPLRPEIRNIQSQPYYNPNEDYVNIPNSSAFESSETYYSTLFHELTHSSGHPSRLNRSTIKTISPFGSHEYSKEELIAEMGSAFLCAHTGISQSTIENSASYISGWLRVLNNDPMMVIQASAQAQKAAHYILGEGNSE